MQAIIFYRNDSTELFTKKMHCRQQIYKVYEFRFTQKEKSRSPYTNYLNLNNFLGKYGNQENITKSRIDKQRGERVRRTQKKNRNWKYHIFTENDTKIY